MGNHPDAQVNPALIVGDRLPGIGEKLGIGLSVIGEIEKDAGIRCIDKDGRAYHPRGTGFEHFRGSP